MALKVCMFVLNNFKHDSRVLKEAKTLADSGYDVRVVALLDNTTLPYEELDGFRVIRVLKNPIHLKILKSFQKILHFPYCILAKLKNKFNKNSMLKGAGEYVSKNSPLNSFILKSLIKAFSWGLNITKMVKSLFAEKFKSLFMIFHKLLCLLDYYYRSIKLVKKERADIYHAHDLNTLPVAYWAKKKMGGKLTYDSHELYVERNTLKKQSKLTNCLLTKAESFLIKSADHVITVSESIAKELKKRYSVKQPSVILNTPSHHVAERTLSLHDELGIPQNYKIVLYVGNVTFNRGLEELIQSIAYLDHCVFVLMGRITNDLYYQKLKKIAQHMGVDNKVYYFGPVHSEDVTEYASSAHVGAASIKKVCLSYYYCLPNKLFEYMAAGLPVVASNFPELKKVIEGHEMGKTFNPDVPEEIAQAINHVISDKDRYDEMKTNALRAAKIFNWENESKKLLEIYKGLENEVCITSN